MREDEGAGVSRCACGSCVSDMAVSSEARGRFVCSGVESGLVKIVLVIEGFCEWPERSGVATFVDSGLGSEFLADLSCSVKDAKLGSSSTSLP